MPKPGTYHHRVVRASVLAAGCKAGTQGNSCTALALEAHATFPYCISAI